MTVRARYEGKTVVITGAAGGLGRAYALGFAGEGAHVIVGDISMPGLEETADMVRQAGGSADAFAVDLGDEESISAFARKVIEKHAAVDVLINNAGIAYGHITENLIDVEQKLWLKYLAVNSVGPVLLADHLHPAITAARKSGRAGVIINQSSMSSFSPSSIYGVTKATLNAITYGMAHAYGAEGIRVLAIAPGLMETPGNRAGLSPELYKWVEDQQILKDEHGKPEDIVSLALFLASPEARFMTADVISCDAGCSIRSWRN
jgi:NAD(P)-dependent dehydrogenase (short-subunit alcohol dehydrogenase family)